jgi:hypothetical protein
MAESVTQDGMTFTSSHQSAEQMRMALETPTDATAEHATPPAELPAGETEKAEPDTPTEERERNPDGTFKAPSDKGKAPAKKPYQTAAEARISKAVASQREAERKAAALEQELAQFRQAQQPSPAPRQPEPPVARPEDDEPTPDKYEGLQYDPKYIRDLSIWQVKQAWQAIAQQAQERQALEQQRAAEAAQMQAHQERVTAARQKYPDFDQRIRPEVPINAPMAHIITGSPVGPELLLYLSEFPEESQRIAQLHPMLAIREMGKLEARCEAALHGNGSASLPAMSAAKPVIKPVTGAPSRIERDDDESLPVEEFIRRGNARDRAARRG